MKTTEMEKEEKEGEEGRERGDSKFETSDWFAILSVGKVRLKSTLRRITIFYSILFYYFYSIGAALTFQPCV